MCVCVYVCAGKFTQKWKLSRYLLSLGPIDSQVKFQKPKSISGASQQNSVAAFSKTVKTLKQLKTKTEHASLQLVRHDLSLQKRCDPKLTDAQF